MCFSSSNCSQAKCSQVLKDVTVVEFSVISLLRQHTGMIWQQPHQSQHNHAHPTHLFDVRQIMFVDTSLDR